MGSQVAIRMPPEETYYRLGGLDCVDCAGRVQKAVAELEGVKNAEVSLATLRLKVLFQGHSDDQLVISAVNKLGYTVEPEDAAKSVLLRVEGMDCADESEIITRKLKSTAGIIDFKVNLMSGQVEVSYDPSRVSVQALIKSIAE
ncbi:MAG: cation transporter, partial [Actinobacteria bacterium]|nr:cation transporter [Actinomycetota bacterium]